MFVRCVNVIAAVFTFASLTVSAADIGDAANYREYSAILSSSGQPSGEQLKDAASNGFERVIYLAYSDHTTSIEHEDRIVKDLGMEYVNIPIDFSAPTLSDFYLIAGAMQREPNKKTLVHCQVNFRASAISFLYRVVYEDVSISDAREDLNSVWVPDETWAAFILDVLKDNDLDKDCDTCDW